MRRLFGKSGKTVETEIRDGEHEGGGGASGPDPEEPEEAHKRTPQPRTRKKSQTDVDDGSGDAGKSSRKRQAKKGRANANEFEGSASSSTGPKRLHDENRRKPRQRQLEDDDVEEQVQMVVPNPKPRPKPKPRQRSTIAESVGPSLVAELSESERDADADTTNDYHHDSPHPHSQSPSPTKGHQQKKERTRKIKKEVPTTQLRRSDFANDSSEEITQFIKKQDLPSLPKIESGKGIHFMSSTYSYRKPISAFKIRARLLKYPTLTDHGVWPGDMAVIDDRIFQWQEKVFSKAEAKRYQKRANCVTEQEKKYHEEISSNSSSIGKSLYSYVSDDPYVLKKTLKLLIRRCPGTHIRKEKGVVRLTATGKAIDSNGDSVDDDYLSEDYSIDFDESFSTSTPKPKRKPADKSKEAIEIAKVEKKVHEKKEKEFKDLERRNLKLKRVKAKREHEELKRTEDEEAKAKELMRKAEAFEKEERNRRQEYVKKYQHHRRPSLPLGVRLRSVQLTPSPRNKQKRTQKGHLSKTVSEPSTDYPDTEKGSSESIRAERGESDGAQDHEQKGDKSKGTRKVGHEHSDKYDDAKPAKSYRAGSPKTRRKFFEGFSFRNSQTMYIMASVPYSPGRSREIVVCMIRNIPRQGVVMFKPALGYRNIEAKRNHVFRVSSELMSSDSKSHKQQRKAGGGDLARFRTPAKVTDDFGGFFELAPKNEMRLTVMGEITTAEGFESSPLNIYYIVDIPKGWRNDSILNHVEGITHSCYTNDRSVAHYSHEFSFHLVFSMDVLESSEIFPTPTISLLVVSMESPSPRIVYEGYGYVNIPMSPGTHFVKIRMWKPKPRTTVEKLRATFLNITPSLQDIRVVHTSYSDNEVGKKVNLLGFQTVPTGTVKIRFNVIHQMPITYNNEHSAKLDLLEKMSSATILRSVQAVIEAFQRARQKAVTLKNQYQ